MTDHDDDPDLDLELALKDIDAAQFIADLDWQREIDHAEAIRRRLRGMTDHITAIERKLAVIKAMLWITIVLMLGVLWLSCTIMERLP
jgi:hypothetical protein